MVVVEEEVVELLVERVVVLELLLDEDELVWEVVVREVLEVEVLDVLEVVLEDVL